MNEIPNALREIIEKARDLEEKLEILRDPAMRGEDWSKTGFGLPREFEGVSNSVLIEIARALGSVADVALSIRSGIQDSLEDVAANLSEKRPNEE